MKYLVTGATGFIGTRVTRQLLAEGHEVRALVRTPARAHELQAAGAQLAEGDVTDLPSVRNAMGGCDGVFHLAGWYRLGVRDASPAEKINVDGTRNVLQAMKEASVPRGVYTSTVAIYSDTRGQMVDETHRMEDRYLSVYEATKARAHQVALDYIKDGLPLVVVLPGAVYGPGDESPVGASLRKYLQRRLPLLPRDSEMCWAHVDDTAHAHLLAMQKGRAGEAYIIAGPRHTVTEVMNTAVRLTRIPPPRIQVSARVIRALAQIMAMLERVAPIPADYTSEYLRATGAATYLGDNTKARKELGYVPRDIDSGLVDTLRADMKRLNLPLPPQLAPGP